MKIKPSRLREIIQEEVSQFNTKMSAPPDDITGEPDEEGAMARSQLLKLAKYSAALMDMMNDNTQLPAWVQAKITKSASYLGAVKHFIEGEVELNEAVDGDPQSNTVSVERHLIQNVVKAFAESEDICLSAEINDELEMERLSKLIASIQALEQILNPVSKNAESDLNEDRQQMKISKQKLERIIKQEVLKEMGRGTDGEFEFTGDDDEDGDYSDPETSKEFTEMAYNELEMPYEELELGELKAEIEEVSGGVGVDGPEVLLKALKRALIKTGDYDDNNAVIKSHPTFTDGKPRLYLDFDKGKW